MISTSQLAKSYGGRTLFENVSLQLNAPSRYGLVGANGSGKTTFLRVLAGDEPASDGTVAIPGRARVGVLRQDRFLDDGQIILDLAMMGDAAVWRALVERNRIIDHGDGDAARLADLEETLKHLDGLHARGARHRGPRGPRHPHRVAPAARSSTLSGGFKLRVLLAQVLLGGPDVLLLDEPTNHLDILSIRWLEKFLAGYRGVALVISHDQRFLDNVATHILDVDYGTITALPGQLHAFVVEKAAARERKEAEIARAEKVIADKRAFVERFGAKATKAKQAQSRLKQIERIEVEELETTSRRAPLFRFTPERPSGRDVLEVSRPVEGVRRRSACCSDVSLTVRRGEKRRDHRAERPRQVDAAQDRHGAGSRPTPGGALRARGARRLLRAGPPRGPARRRDDAARLHLGGVSRARRPTFVRGQLGRVLFSGEDVDKPIGALSGGEAARLVFCRIIVEQPNVLVLDEPTNHLDLEAIAALVDGLKAFEGTVLFVSHDRWFVSELATRILEVTAEGPRDFPGTYGEYLERCGDDHLDAEAVVLKAKTAKARDRQAEVPSDGSSWEEQKRRRNRLAALPGRRDKVLAAIDPAEARRKAIASAYVEPEFFARTPPVEVEKMAAEDRELGKKIESLLAEWEQIEKEIALLETQA